MRILYATPLLPFPVEQGHQMICYNRVRALAALGHEVTVIAFYRKPEDLAQSQQELATCARQVVGVHLPRWKPVSNIVSTGLVSAQPLQVLYFRSAAFRRAVASLKPESFDVIHINTFRLAPYFMAYRRRCVLDLLDSMTLNIGRRLAQEKGLARLAYGLELRRVKEYEKEIVKQFPLSLVVGEADRETIAAASGQPVVRLPLSVDETAFSRRGPLPLNRVLLFSGNMGYTPNIDAVRWFMENCWAVIKAAVPEARFHIAGANPTAATLAYAQQPGVQVLGRVASMAETLNQAQMAIAPMQIGSGMQTKILEAMACGLPMVCTSFCIGPIEARPEHDVVVADGPEDFAQACIRLLNDEGKCLEISKHATDFIARTYSNAAHARRLAELYGQVVRQAGASA